MPTTEFAFRPALQELTDAVNGQLLDPYEAYEWLYAHSIRRELQPDYYLSTSITSGGHARDDSLQMGDIIARNTESARLLADQLAGDRQINPMTTIEPVFVGKTHWNQAQFMEFWLSVIGGFELTPGFVSRDVDNLRLSAQAAFQSAELDLDLMVSKVPAADRATEYFKMSGAFAGLIRNGAEATPIGTVVRMIDTDLSLGSQTERIFARQIGSKVMNISVVQPADPGSLAAVNHRLAADTERLISFGATVFDTRNDKVRLLLTEDAA